MKIKNLKLMLLGLLAMGSMDVFGAPAEIGPAVDAVITRANLAFKVTARAKDDGTLGKVTFLGMVASPDKTDADGAIANQPDGTITIPASVWTLYGEKGNKVNYEVTAIDPGWSTSYGDYANVKAKLQKLVSQVVEKDGSGKVISNLKATSFAALEEVILPEGQTVLAKDAFYGCAKLATINLGNIADFGQGCLMGTAITSLDLSKAVTIGPSAFQDVTTVESVTIPATVETIGANAFLGMYKEEIKDGKTVKSGLKELTFNANSDETKGFAAIPAVFAGDKLLAKVTITSSKATAFEANAFKDAIVLEELDLTGCSELGAIAANDFAASTAFKSIKLAGTKLKNIDNLDITGSHQTLATITLPTTLETLQANKFKNFVALTALDLSETAVKAIPTSLCEYSTTDSEEKYIREKNEDGTDKIVDGKYVYVEPVLASVALNPETATIGIWAFAKQNKLATVTGFNQDKLKSIGEHAFYGTALTTLDLSAATNAAFVTIDNQTFANMATLTTITLPVQITTIKQGAFAYDAAVTSINLQDLTKLTALNDLFHLAIASPGDDNDVAIALATVTLPEDGDLVAINDGALQLLDIEEIVIPSTVTSFGSSVLQGCISLKKFTWEDAQVNSISVTTFVGDDKLEEVRFMTLSNSTVLGSTSNDNIFEGNDKDVLKVYVNAEAYAILRAAGWSEANLKYCTLVGEGESEYELPAAGKAGEFYYATYRNKDNATWFKADEVELFTAVVEGYNVVLKAASTEGGFYKVAKYGTSVNYIDANGEQQKNAVCIIRAKNQKIIRELKAAYYNNLSTLSDDNALQVARKDFKPSRLKYQYKLGAKDGVVAFWRVTSGTIKKDGIFIDSAVAKDRLDIVFEGDATAIQNLTVEDENTGAIYNLNGVRVKNAQKGIYIQNGKKYVK